jgi:septum formation inhibitor MinC
MSELENKIQRLNDSQKTEALLFYLSDSRFRRALQVLEKSIDDIIEHLQNNNIVEKLNDKDDKSFDRGKILLKDLLDLVKDLEEAKMSPLNVEQSKDLKKKATGNSILSIIKQQRGEA